MLCVYSLGSWPLYKMGSGDIPGDLPLPAAPIAAPAVACLSFLTTPWIPYPSHEYHYQHHNDHAHFCILYQVHGTVHVCSEYWDHTSLHLVTSAAFQAIGLTMESKSLGGLRSKRCTLLVIMASQAWTNAGIQSSQHVLLCAGLTCMHGGHMERAVEINIVA